MTVFLADWKDIADETRRYSDYVGGIWTNLELVGGQAIVLQEFEAPADALEGAELLLAYYDYEDYSGDAFVLFRKDGQLYTVEGSHCSCYGLEGQWKPDETDVPTLLHRICEGYLGSSSYDWERNQTWPRESKFRNELLRVLIELDPHQPDNLAAWGKYARTRSAELLLAGVLF